MNHSGVIGALLQFLTGSESDSEEQEGEGEGRDSAEQVVACEDRLRLFLHVFADMPLASE